MTERYPAQLPHRNGHRTARGGVGFGATDLSINQLGSRTRARGRAARLTLLNSAFGVGAVLGPAVVGVLGVRALTLGFAVAAVAAAAMAVGVLGISTEGPTESEPERAASAAAGCAAGPIFPIGLDWVAATFTGYRPATSWALTGSFAGGVVGPAAVAGVVSVAGLHAVPAVLTALSGATFLAFLAIWRSAPRPPPG